jgi:hypothetical protein
MCHRKLRSISVSPFLHPLSCADSINAEIQWKRDPSLSAPLSFIRISLSILSNGDENFSKSTSNKPSVSSSRLHPSSDLLTLQPEDCNNYLGSSTPEDFQTNYLANQQNMKLDTLNRVCLLSPSLPYSQLSLDL